MTTTPRLAGLLTVALLAGTFARAEPAASQPATQPAAPKAARSVHLAYAGAEGAGFYNELTVERSVPGSYFMACGFRHGYFGIQEQAKGRKVVLFSVWDPTPGNDAKAVPEGQRVEILAKADDVTAKRFGGEGTGGQSFFEYDWKPGQTYRFFVRATVAGTATDPVTGEKKEDKKTAYAGYFWLPEKNAWKHLVTFRTRSGGDALGGLYSFVEDFRRDTRSAREDRRAVFGNGWLLDARGRWEPLTRARFTASGATWEARETIDAGLVDGRFYLQTGGETKTSTPLGTMMQRPAGDAKPPEVPGE